jgi:hypothetical protein
MTSLRVALKLSMAEVKPVGGGKNGKRKFKKALLPDEDISLIEGM